MNLEQIQKQSEYEKREIDIISGFVTPKTLGELQIFLAGQLYRTKLTEVESDCNLKIVRDKMMNYWVDSNYAANFRELVNEISRGDVLQTKNMNPLKITLEEIEEFAKRRNQESIKKAV